MATAGINFQKLREKGDLSYLVEWYCPLEKEQQWDREESPGRGGELSLSWLTLPLALPRPLLNWQQREIIAGF
ncbi:hypothetical protein [Desulfofundulus thermosubterraneus]|uniref:Uncharacterized protein n=1 Tax=Desulfofundulus thermosubterraneus DSM 16057 TaxID=1121432 RepID=A0A1M6AG12_9FIRM|nr:hypothetical protein [Desulfofundulus thermosubterraneus]SHI35399.1 hypothetical protein SAMN02745219_00133 [Desulfofundulus thermosubterraneus DSM 16057]